MNDDALSLEQQHRIECEINRDLSDSEIGRLCEYLADDPMSTDDLYLIDLFGLNNRAA